MLGILKLSVSDVIVSQKGSNGDKKLHFFGRDYKENQNSPMETNATGWVDFKSLVGTWLLLAVFSPS